ncbi:MAG: Cof-type HAD-IIB family hydrolase [Oscillospiraceae bacterium]|nr:Cof-type HAD-IIB family hydrolase [Oscillospiraceae bacterium]
MEIRLIALDLDGTLLNSHKEISAENYHALQAAAEQGTLIVPCTGRFYLGMPEQVRQLPFVRYAITVNGAEVYDTCTETALYRAEIQPPEAERVIDVLDTLPVIYDCYLEGWGYMPAELYNRAGEFVSDPHILRMIRELRKPVEDFRGHIRGKSLQKIQMFFRDQTLRMNTWRQLEEGFPELSITSSSPYNIEINAGNATKGAAMLALCGALGIPREQTMAFGDSSNDKTMIEAAGIGVAMGNALPEIREMADFVTDTNDRGGVGLAVRRFCGLSK